MIHNNSCLNQQVVDPSDDGLGSLKKVVRCSNPDSCIWRKPSLVKATHLWVPLDPLEEISLCERLGILLAIISVSKKKKIAGWTNLHVTLFPFFGECLLVEQAHLHAFSMSYTFRLSQTRSYSYTVNRSPLLKLIGYVIWWFSGTLSLL